jgi:RNA polymerase sigma-70 factor, ECF subfamily
LVALSGQCDHDGMGEGEAGVRVGDRSTVETRSGRRCEYLDIAEQHMSKRQHAREADGIRSSWETNGPGFQAFYQENVTPIYRYVLSKVDNREEAEDLTSQVFLKAVRGMNPERGSQAMRQWLYQVAHTTIADYWRNYYRLPTGSLDALSDADWDGSAAGEPAMDSVVSSHPGERVKRLMQALPAHYREVLTCRFLLNLSIRETATRLGLTEANVKVLQFRVETRRCCRTRCEQKLVTAKA